MKSRTTSDFCSTPRVAPAKRSGGKALAQWGFHGIQKMGDVWFHWCFRRREFEGMNDNPISILWIIMGLLWMRSWMVIIMISISYLWMIIPCPSIFPHPFPAFFTHQEVENPNLTWMINQGYPHVLGNHHQSHFPMKYGAVILPKKKKQSIDWCAWFCLEL